MGARSKEKVLEILETGTLRRNAVLAMDEQQQVIQLVSIIHCESTEPQHVQQQLYTSQMAMRALTLLGAKAEGQS